MTDELAIPQTFSQRNSAMADVALGAITGLMLTAEQRKNQLAATGLSPIFDQQTPKVEPFDTTKIDNDTFDLIRDVGFFAKWNMHLDLAGLAANQLQKDGRRLDLRLCYIMVDGCLRDALNPVIVEKFGPTYRSKEGCLTWPGKRIVALRNTGVEVEFLDATGGLTPCKRRVEGFEAIIWQHEIDHLDGVVEEFVIQLAKGQNPGPNDPCPCSSGRKFKKCCGR
jgi:peptide deformylase